MSTDTCLTNGSGNKSFIWRIRGGGGRKDSFLFGTVHVPYTRVWDSIGKNVKDAFVKSDVVMFELDLLNPETISDLAECQLLPNNQKLSEIIPINLFKRLKKHLNYVKYRLPSWMNVNHRHRGLYSEYLFNAMTSNWERKRPIWILLMINSLTESDVRSRGIPTLDVYLAQEAQRMNKKTGSVEKASDNCSSLNNMNVNYSIFALNDTLNQHELMRKMRREKRRNRKKKKKRQEDGDFDTSPDVEDAVTTPATVTDTELTTPSVVHVQESLLNIMPTDDLAKHYNCGNLTFFTSKSDIQSLIQSKVTANVGPNNTILVAINDTIASKIDDYIRKELIVNRNKKWTRKMDRILRNNPNNESFFFAFGAGHLIGNFSVVQMLRSAGFVVDRM